MFRFLQWRSVFRRSKFEHDMADEFAFHLEARTKDLMRSGVSRQEAERIARIEFGGGERYRAECRESHRVNWADEITRNSAYAWRNLVKSPLFAFTAIASLALGLAAVGVIFAVVHTVLLRPLPFAQSSRVVTISQRVAVFGSAPTVVTPSEFLAWRKSGIFESAALVDTNAYTLEQSGHAERIYGASVTPDFFRVFEIQPFLGRGFSTGDAIPGHDHVIVLSRQLWARDFASDPAIAGKTIQVSGMPMTVIGVMPAGFDFPRLADVSQIMSWAPEQTEFWTPLVLTESLIKAGNFNYYALGRLRPGITVQRAASQLLPPAIRLFKEMELQAPQYKEMIEQNLGTFVVYVTPLRETMAWGVHDVLWMLLAAVALLFVLVLFNLGNLLLTRNAQRLREYAVRQALGASRWQLLRQSLFEQTALVGVSSIVAGILISLGIEGLRTVALNKVPRLHELQFSVADMATLVAIALVTAILFGAFSQLLTSEALISLALSSQGRTATSDRRSSRLRFGFVAGEIAASAVLLVAAGLLLQSFHNVLRQQPGFNPQHVLTVTVPFSAQNEDKPEKRLKHIRQLLERLRALPGVESASIVNRLPLAGDTEIHDVQALGKPVPVGAENMAAERRVIDAAYFQAMQIPLISGRMLRPDDANTVAVVNEQMARRLWPGKSAIDQQFRDGDNPPMRVVGVVGDVHYGSLEKQPMMQFYGSINADPYFSDTFVMRSRQDPLSLVPIVEKTVAELDPSEPVTHAQTMQNLLDAVTLQRRFETGLLSSFAAAALFLSALGLFGIASLSAARRTREFGIRLAVGATRSDIVRLELARTAAIVLVGLGTGLIASIAVARAMAGLLYRVSPENGAIFAIAALLLVACTLLAGWWPAKRAASIDPAAALRAD